MRDGEGAGELPRQRGQCARPMSGWYVGSQKESVVVARDQGREAGGKGPGSQVVPGLRSAE